MSVFGRKRQREAAFREAAASKPAPAPESSPYVRVGWFPSTDTGQELGELETLESLQIARRTYLRAVEAARDSSRLLTDAKEALDEAKARVRRMAERA